MSDAQVIDLAEARIEKQMANTPHVVGNARCVGCGNEYVAVAPLSFFEENPGRGLQCGRCGRFLVNLDPVESTT